MYEDYPTRTVSTCISGNTSGIYSEALTSGMAPEEKRCLYYHRRQLDQSVSTRNECNSGNRKACFQDCEYGWTSTISGKRYRQDDGSTTLP